MVGPDRGVRTETLQLDMILAYCVQGHSISCYYNKNEVSCAIPMAIGSS